MRRVFFIALGCVLLASVGLLIGHRSEAIPWDASADVRLRDSFKSPATPERPYDDIFAYVVSAFSARALPGGAGAIQPGARSRNGVASDQLESFSRLAPLVGTWVASGRPTTIIGLSGVPIDLKRLLHDGIVHGTDPSSSAYWGAITDLNQRIVEAADIARTLWIVRTNTVFTQNELEQAGRWVRQVNGHKTPDNNWNLYPVIVNVALQAIGLAFDEPTITSRFARFMNFYKGDGWFTDGGTDDFDFYNAWAIHYELFWLRRMSPDFGGELVRRAMSEFTEKYLYLIGPNGVPIMGRSICYRMAAPSPLVAAALDGHFSPGLGRRALDAVWSFYLQNGAIANGVATQGYFAPDMRLLDNYSGPASCLWSLRSLIVAFIAPPEATFWTAPSESLPVEKADYSVVISAIEWTVTGSTSTRTITIRKKGLATQSAPVQAYTWWRKLASSILWRPFRPDNVAAKYERAVYSSDSPICGCN